MWFQKNHYKILAVWPPKRALFCKRGHHLKKVLFLKRFNFPYILCELRWHGCLLLRNLAPLGSNPRHCVHENHSNEAFTICNQKQFFYISDLQIFYFFKVFHPNRMDLKFISIKTHISLHNKWCAGIMTNKSCNISMLRSYSSVLQGWNSQSMASS